MTNLEIRSPKLRSNSRLGRANWYPYYAGFSGAFVHCLVSSIKGEKTIRILDPWNGSGTTTAIGRSLGHVTYGYDLNPAMVVIAKARVVSRREKSSFSPITADVIEKSRHDDSSVTEEDPLCVWFTQRSAESIRRIERSLQVLLVDETCYSPLVLRGTDCLSDIAAFFYTALFRTVRLLLKEFFVTNPTWIKRPRDQEGRVDAMPEAVFDKLKAEIQIMMAEMDSDPFHVVDSETEVIIKTGSSENLPLPDKTVDLVISSPPYCTRIDYAVATMTELAVMGYDQRGSFDSLRRTLIGTSTVPKGVPDVSEEWGQTCNAFLRRVQNHESKASKTYYHKNLIQYFSSINKSLSELQRVVRSGGLCVLVVQDSYYKDVHNDLPQMFAEMAGVKGLSLGRKVDFRLGRTMAGINPAVKEYREEASAVESVLCFLNG